MGAARASLWSRRAAIRQCVRPDRDVQIPTNTSCALGVGDRRLARSHPRRCAARARRGPAAYPVIYEALDRAVASAHLARVVNEDLRAQCEPKPRRIAAGQIIPAFEPSKRAPHAYSTVQDGLPKDAPSTLRGYISPTFTCAPTNAKVKPRSAPVRIDVMPRPRTRTKGARQQYQPATLLNAREARRRSGMLSEERSSAPSHRVSTLSHPRTTRSTIHLRNIRADPESMSNIGDRGPSSERCKLTGKVAEFTPNPCMRNQQIGVLLFSLAELNRSSRSTPLPHDLEGGHRRVAL